MGFCKFSKSSFLFLITILFVSAADENSQLENDRVALLSFTSVLFSSLETPWNIGIPPMYMSATGRVSVATMNETKWCSLTLVAELVPWSHPTELGSLFRLKQLSLSWNLLQGNIPSELGFLPQLVYLDFGSNRLDGNIPASLFCNGSYSLQYIDLSNNSLSGEIPLTSKCSLRELRLSGELPSEIIRNMPQLQFLYLSYNDFVSHDGNTNLEPFFTALLNSSNFQELELAGNNLGGQIPPFIGDLSTNFVQIHLDDNLIYGLIPPRISNLVNLTLLNLSSNLLNGSIPQELCRMERLERVYLSNNSLSGEIPVALGNITHLGLLDLSMNKLSGSIPDSFADLAQLRRLLLYGNQLSGTIPLSLGKCVNLEILDLSHNKLSGIIPGEVAGLRSLKLYLNFSSNHLHGPLPLELTRGLHCPRAPQPLSNALEGELPGSVGQLPYLKELDVGFNQLSGDIPATFQASMTLVSMNFSFNKFHGNISDKGAFSSLTIDSFVGNDGLCGSIKGLQKCRKKYPSRLVIFLPIIASLLVTPLLLMFGDPLVNKSKFGNRMAVVDGEDFEDEENERKELKYPRISYEQLIEATAVKVLDTKTAGEISGTFKRECEVLKRTRHRNLIRIITICSKPDFKALVLPLMPNGSLERHLYPSHGIRNGLDFIQLVNICSDVAEGVAYLHHYAPVKVVHCDLKPSNILLDEDMTALVTDFGIARLVRGVDETTSANDSISYNSADGLLCGSVGYIAPEYGMGKRASTQGDVYSFGVLLLEIVSGRRPIDNEAGSSLHEWVKSHYPHKLEPIVKQALVRCSLVQCQQVMINYGVMLYWNWLNLASCAHNTTLQQDQTCWTSPLKWGG
ncbi:putative leucine-rich repeat receptor-like serine/threonine-protein kinase [Hibiscus syriacus]|uniref:non-specific serine/threonine protein kinase n=1 Tax=Hibiscus syriacus TaxID=106335 RepID=A0A6A3D481_HIBSY|nr:putative leucine-rich repeat receptor-like serine/threonine-protein kinase [Hibiscus syriacus]